MQMPADPNKLGIFVTSPQNMRHVVGVTKAAVRAGMKTMVFFTFKAVHLAKTSEFLKVANLCEIKDLAICAASYQCEGYDVEDVPKGITGRQMATQAYHGVLLEECGKYLVL
jgi:peroxiredoxin family protein